MKSLAAYLFYSHRYRDQYQTTATVLNWYDSFRDNAMFMNRCEADPEFKKAVDPSHWHYPYIFGNYETHWTDKQGNPHHKECVASYLHRSGISEAYFKTMWTQLPTTFDLTRNKHNGQLDRQARAYMADILLIDANMTEVIGQRSPARDPDKWTTWNAFLSEQIKYDTANGTQIWKYRDGDRWKIVNIGNAQTLPPYTKLWAQQGALADEDEDSPMSSSPSATQKALISHLDKHGITFDDHSEEYVPSPPVKIMCAPEFEAYLDTGKSPDPVQATLPPVTPDIRTYIREHMARPDGSFPSEERGVRREISPTQKVTRDNELNILPSFAPAFANATRNLDPVNTQELEAAVEAGISLMNNTMDLCRTLFNSEEFNGWIELTPEQRRQRARDINDVLEGCTLTTQEDIERLMCD
jgi:hypothetical protein